MPETLACTSAIPPELVSTIANAIPTIATAALSIFSIWFGSYLTTTKERKEIARRYKEETRLLVAQILPALFENAKKCLKITYDDGNYYGRPSGEDGIPYPTFTDTQPFSPDLNLNWKILPTKILLDVFKISIETKSLEDELSHTWEFTTPFFKEYYIKRQLGYAQIGLLICQIINNLTKISQNENSFNISQIEGNIKIRILEIRKNNSTPK